MNLCSRPDLEQRYYEYFFELKPIIEKPLIEYGWEDLSLDSEDPFPNMIDDDLINQLDNKSDPELTVMNKMDASSSVTSWNNSV